MPRRKNPQTRQGARITIETARQVADFAEDPEDGWEPAAGFRPSEREFRTALKSDLAEIGIKPWNSRRFTFRPDSVAFVEFDAANSLHAGAIYQAEFDGPTDLIERLNGPLNDLVL